MDWLCEASLSHFDGLALFSKTKPIMLCKARPFHRDVMALLCKASPLWQILACFAKPFHWDELALHITEQFLCDGFCFALPSFSIVMDRSCFANSFQRQIRFAKHNLLRSMDWLCFAVSRIVVLRIAFPLPWKFGLPFLAILFFTPISCRNTSHRGRTHEVVYADEQYYVWVTTPRDRVITTNCSRYFHCRNYRKPTKSR